MGTIAENVGMGGISHSVTRAESLGLSPLENTFVGIFLIWVESFWLKSTA